MQHGIRPEAGRVARATSQFLGYELKDEPLAQTIMYIEWGHQTVTNPETSFQMTGSRSLLR